MRVDLRHVFFNAVQKRWMPYSGSRDGGLRPLRGNDSAASAGKEEAL